MSARPQPCPEHLLTGSCSVVEHCTLAHASLREHVYQHLSRDFAVANATAQITPMFQVHIAPIPLTAEEEEEEKDPMANDASKDGANDECVRSQPGFNFLSSSSASKAFLIKFPICCSAIVKRFLDLPTVDCVQVQAKIETLKLPEMPTHLMSSFGSVRQRFSSSSSSSSRPVHWAMLEATGSSEAVDTLMSVLFELFNLISQGRRVSAEDQELISNHCHDFRTERAKVVANKEGTFKDGFEWLSLLNEDARKNALLPPPQAEKIKAESDHELHAREVFTKSLDIPCLSIFSSSHFLCREVKYCPFFHDVSLLVPSTFECTEAGKKPEHKQYLVAPPPVVSAEWQPLMMIMHTNREYLAIVPIAPLPQLLAALRTLEHRIRTESGVRIIWPSDELAQREMQRASAQNPLFLNCVLITEDSTGSEHTCHLLMRHAMALMWSCISDFVQSSHSMHDSKSGALEPKPPMYNPQLLENYLRNQPSAPDQRIFHAR